MNDETLVFTAFRACGRTISDDGKSWSGARGRTRTGMESPPRDFRTRYSFRCWVVRGARPIWSLDFLFAVRLAGATGERLGRGRQVSTLSVRAFGAWLSSGLQSRRAWCWFPEFDPIHAGRFRAGCSIFQVPCVYQFRHPGNGCGAIVSHRAAVWASAGENCSAVATSPGCDGGSAAGVW